VCLGIPAKVIEVREDNTAIVDYGGIKKLVDSTLLPDVKPGDYVIVHAGAIIERISEQEYQETMEILREILRSMDENR